MDWLVFYTKARWEKKVAGYLQKFGFEAFLPLVSEVHQWSDRKKKVEVPLFRSYIFVKEPENKIPELLQIPGISWAIQHEGKPAKLSQRDKDILDRIIDTGFSVEEYQGPELEPGDEVQILEGPLQGIKAEILKQHGKTMVLRLHSIDKVIRLSIQKDLIKKI